MGLPIVSNLVKKPYKIQDIFRIHFQLSATEIPNELLAWIKKEHSSFLLFLFNRFGEYKFCSNMFCPIKYIWVSFQILLVCFTMYLDNVLVSLSICLQYKFEWPLWRCAFLQVFKGKVLCYSSHQQKWRWERGFMRIKFFYQGKLVYI